MRKNSYRIFIFLLVLILFFSLFSTPTYSIIPNQPSCSILAPPVGSTHLRDFNVTIKYQDPQGDGNNLNSCDYTVQPKAGQISQPISAGFCDFSENKTFTRTITVGPGGLCPEQTTYASTTGWFCRIYCEVSDDQGNTNKNSSTFFIDFCEGKNCPPIIDSITLNPNPTAKACWSCPAPTTATVKVHDEDKKDQIQLRWLNPEIGTWGPWRDFGDFDETLLFYDTGTKTIKVQARDNNGLESIVHLKPITVTCPNCSSTAQNPGKIKVMKIVINDDGGNKTPQDFKIKLFGNNPTPSWFMGTGWAWVGPGPFNVTEVQLPGYSATFTGNCSGTISAGEMKICTIINNDIPQIKGSIEICKLIIDQNNNTITDPSFLPYTEFNITMLKGDPPGNFPLGLALFNTTSFLLNKDLIGNDQINDSRCIKFENLTIQPYTYREEGILPSEFWQPPKYNDQFQVPLMNLSDFFTYSPELFDSNISNDLERNLNSDGHIVLLPDRPNRTLVVLNQLKPSNITIIKQVINDNGGTKQISDFTLFVNQTQVQSNQTNAFLPGIYFANESEQQGYAKSFTGDCDQNGKIILGLGQSKTCIITNNDIPPKLIVIKQVINNDGGDFEADEFTIHVNASNPSDDEFLAQEFPGVNITLNAGAYNVTEEDPQLHPPAYQANFSQDCSGTINIGETKVCTIINDDIPPYLTLIKQVINDNGGNKTVSDFILKIDGTQVTSEVPKKLTFGFHTASEEEIEGYSASSWGADCSPQGSVFLTLGENNTCIITNNDIPSNLTLIKNVINDNGGTLQVQDFPLFINQTQVTSSQQNTLNAGFYQASETQNSGYQPSSWSGDCNPNGTITLGLNQSKTCTITNNDISPNLTVIKQVINQNNGNKTVSDFSLFVDATQVTSGVTNFFDAGSHLVSEIQQQGYTSQISGDCLSNGTVILNPADNKTCIITNTDQPANLTVIKIVINNNGGNKTVQDFALFVGATQVQSNQTNQFPQGMHTVSEIQLPGYNATFSGDCNQTGQVSLLVGQSKTCTITNDDIFIPGEIHGIKFEDENGNGIKDTGEPFLANWIINLTGPQNKSTQTDAQGAFHFLNLSAGNYTLTETLKTGWLQTTSAPPLIQIDSGTNSTNNSFGNFRLGRVSGNKFNDLNADGIWQEGVEPPLENWTITLQYQNGTLLEELTDQDGHYIFRNLTAGNYTVNEILKVDWLKTKPLTNNGTYKIQISSASQFVNKDFGNFKPGKIIVHKDVLSHNNTNITDNHNFTTRLNATNPKTLSEQTTAIYENLTTGLYTISEDPDSNYDLVSIIPTQPVNITSGSTIHVFIVNKQKPAQLLVIKQVINNNSGTATPQNFTLHVKQNNLDVPNSPLPGSQTGTLYNLTQGNYEVSEDTPLEGYIQLSITGNCLSNGTVNLQVGQLKTCTITNDDIPNTTLKVIKYVINDNGGNKTVPDFPLFIDNLSVTSEEIKQVSPSQHTVSETQQSGYSATISGDCNPNGTINLQLGENKVCTITNNDIPPRLIVTKLVINNDGGILNPSNFTIQVSANNPNPNNFPGSSQGTNVSLNIGSYNVTEILPTTYQSSFSQDCQGEINAGETKYCNITNDDIRQRNGSITICKVILNPWGEVVTDGVDLPASTFLINLSKGDQPNQTTPIATKIFDTQTFWADTDLFGDYENDAQCMTYENLPLNSYFYSQEQIIDEDFWKDPKYNDQDVFAVEDLFDFYLYSPELFTLDPSDDPFRNLDSDGQIILTNDRPDRTLVLLNKLEKLGSIKICKVIIDEEGEIVTNACNMPSATFNTTLIKGDQPNQTTQVGTAHFQTPDFHPDEDILNNDYKDDSECVEFDNLPLGTYFYEEEKIFNQSEWKPPKYNDQDVFAVEDLFDFYLYSPELFDSDPSNDSQRNLDSDGQIILTHHRPNRILVILNGLGVPDPPCDPPEDWQEQSIQLDLNTQQQNNQPNQQEQTCEINQGEYCTQTQGEWGQRCKNNNIGCLRDENWDEVIAGDLNVGIQNTLTFEDEDAIRDYLPAKGQPKVLTQDYENPQTTESGSLGGQLVALKLNILFSNKGIGLITPASTNLDELYIALGPFQTYTVQEFLTLAEQVLGGDLSTLPQGTAISDVRKTAAKINKNFLDCTQDLGYLVKDPSCSQ